MDRRSFLKLAAGLSGALGLGFLLKGPAIAPIAALQAVNSPPESRLTNAKLQEIYQTLKRDGAFDPIDYRDGQYVRVQTS